MYVLWLVKSNSRDKATLNREKNQAISLYIIKPSDRYSTINQIIQQLNVLLYNTLNSSLTYYIEIRQAISQ